MTLRNGVLAIALAALVAGIVLLAMRAGTGLELAIGGGVLVLLVLGERWRYVHRRREGEAVGRFVKTGERYRDPESDRLMEVEFDPASGARRYVPLADADRKGDPS